MRYLPIFAAAIAAMVIGFLWYSPVLFANPWMKAMGHDPNDKAKLAEMQKHAGPMYGSTFIATLITAFVLWVFARTLGSQSVMDGVQLGLWTWAGFVAPIKFTDAIFGRRGRALLFIDSGYQLVCFLVMAVILCAWHPGA